MRRGSARYEENLDTTTTSEDESSSLSDIDLLNPRPKKKSTVRGSGQFPRLFNSIGSTSSLTLDARSRRKSTLTKLPPEHSRCGNIHRILHHSEQRVIFEESEKLRKFQGLNCIDVKPRRKAQGTPRIIRAIRHHSERLNVKYRSDRSLIGDLKKDSSKSSVVVLYHGENKKSPETLSVSSPKPPDRISKSEQTLVTVALPTLGVSNTCPEGKTEPVDSVSELPTRKAEPRIPESPGINSPSLRGASLPRRKLTRNREAFSEARRRESLNANNRVPRVRRRRSSDKSTRGNWDVEVGERRYAREQCGEIDRLPRSLRLMAHRSTSPREDSRYPQVAFLMQHMQNQQQSGQVSNTNCEPEESTNRVFPFQATASGNLKIIPNQVVFESKKVSVLVADPRHTKVNVKAELGRGENNVRPEAATDPGVEDESSDFKRQQRVTGIPEFPSRAAVTGIDHFGNEEKLPTVEPEYVPRTQPYRSSQNNRPREMEQNQVVQTAPHRLPLPATEVPLSSLGFTGEQPIDWGNIILPEKTDLYRELARRITNYKNADCIVRLGHDEFHCHLLVLQSYSTYFDEKNCKEVDLTGSSVTSKAFGIIYDWMISPTNESCHLLRRDNILEIFMAAQQLGIKELEEQCWAFIDNDELFTEDTAFLLYLEARKIGNTAVMELMVPRIMKFFLMLVSTKDFLELSVEELCLLLRSNYICVNSEMEVLMSAVRWLMHDWQSRKQHMMQVLKCVRFGLIAPWQLVDVKRNPENPEFMELMSYPEVQKMVDDGLAFVIIKYWYGNQTEDYYHWIDLLGLIEPTNRNWAGEDKNYVTYREFLLYLEEYQRTKMPELKCRKSPGGKVNPMSGAACNNSPSNPPAPPRLKANSQANNTNLESAVPPSGGAHLGPLLFAASNNLGRTGGKYSRSPGAGVGQAPPSGPMPMPPELLGCYLSSFDRNAKGTTPRNSEDRRVNDGAGETPRRVQYDRDERHWQPNVEISSMTKNPSRKAGKRNFAQDRREYRDGDSSRSEEDAATTIQAIYRGYKARRKIGEIRKSCSEERQNARKVAELLAINAGDNLHKPLEPVRISASSASHNKEANNCTKTSRRSPSPRKKRINSSLEERTSSSKDLEGIRFDVVKTKPLPESYHNDAAKSIQMIHRPSTFHNFDEKTSSISDNTDTDADLFSPRPIEKRSYPEIHSRNPREVGLGDNGTVNHQRNLPLRISDSIIGGNGSNDYYGKDSLFFADRESIVVFGGLDPHQEYGNTGNTAKDMYRFKPSENEWEFVGEIPEPRHHHSIAFLKGRVYLVGGADPRDDNLERKDRVVGTVWSYDPTTRVWYREPAMLTPRKDFGLVVSGGKMYAIGGQDKNGLALRSVEAFDPLECVWQDMRPMCSARVGPATAKYRELIWVGGGMTKSKKEPLTKEVECYDPVCNLWMRAEPLRFPRCFASMYVVCDSLYVVAGTTKSSSPNNSYDITESIESVDVWDPTSRIWRQHGEIGIPRHGHAIGSIGNQLIIVGGLTTVYMKSLKNVECYCCQSAKSIKGVSSLPYPLSGHDCVSLPAANFLTTI